MSLKSILKSFWDGVVSLFANLDALKKEAISVGVVAVEKLKTVLDSGAVDLITYLVPGDADNKAVAIAREFLPKVLVWLKLADKAQLGDVNELIIAAAQSLSELEGDIKNAFQKEIATLTAREASSKTITFGDTGALVENYYKTTVKAS